MVREDPACKGGRKGGKTSAHNPSKVSAAQIQVYLKGIYYPNNKQQLVQHARSRGAPDDVMSFMNQMPERRYNSPIDVNREFGKMK